uniref:Uncharacterized protein n=1 Tax=Peronospora matthiolae TaxID=2874970 RepID=A0AAV1TGD7_9STRA
MEQQQIFHVSIDVRHAFDSASVAPAVVISPEFQVKETKVSGSTHAIAFFCNGKHSPLRLLIGHDGKTDKT